MNLNTKNTFLILVLIIALGGFLRFWQLGTMPPSLNWDEVSHGYNAYSILKTGMDEWGIHFPLIFKAFGDYKLPVYIYLSTLPVWLFGLNSLAVRFVSALAGTLAIPGIYLLFKKLFPEPRTEHFALATAFLLAISPWHFFISRPALEANLALTLIIFGFYFLIRYLNSTLKTSHFALLFSSVLLGLSLHTYNTARVFVPLMLLVAIFIYRKKFLLKSSLLMPALIFAASILLVVIQVFSGEATARYSKLQILSESAVFQIGEQRLKSPFSPIVTKFVYNRPVYFAKTVTSNYLKYFTPQFFYQTWGAQYQFAIPQKNLLTLPVYLFFLTGIVYLLQNLKSKSMQFLLFWLLLSPLAASLTADPPQALRPNPMIPSLIIISVLGLNYFSNFFSQKINNLLLMGFLVWTAFSFGKYLTFYYHDYKNTHSQSWQYGYSQVIEYITRHSLDYENIFITKRYGEPHIFYSFYAHLNPLDLQPNNTNIRFKKSDWFWTDKINNVYFVNDWQIPNIGVSSLPVESGQIISTHKSLLITSPDHIPVNAHILESIKFLDGTPAYIISSIP